jgi:CDP-diacylglycerol--glycerol-3-phosphate 3-phosphatidyltransferase
MGTLTERGRGWIRTVMEPPARVLLAAHVSPDAVTVVGTVATSVILLWFIPRGQFWQAVLIALVFAFADSLDGTMARLAGRTSVWGAFLDSSLDRVTDAAAFLAIAWFYVNRPDDHPWLAVTLLGLVGGFLVSYARAKAEGLGLRADVGVAERTERLVTLAVALLLADAFGLGFLAAGVTLVAVLSWITFGQRIWAVRRQAVARR